MWLLYSRNYSMTLFDILFYNVFNHYKQRKNRNANRIALYYISILQCSLLLLSGILIGIFLDEMNTTTISSDKAWLLFILACMVIVFKNWIQYSGKKRKVLNAKSIHKNKPAHYPIILLWCLLLGSLGLSMILLYQIV